MPNELAPPATGIVLCTDLDRTLIPNGLQPESVIARPLFSKLVQRPEITLVYVSGRDRSLVKQSIKEFALPRPDYVIADVGTTIYHLENDYWHVIEAWRRHIAAGWRGMGWRQLAHSIGEIAGLELQDEAKQSDCKLSYQIDPAEKLVDILPLLKRKLENIDIEWICIDSIDETENQGLVDVLPASAGKRPAIDFLADHLNMSEEQLVFSGDSGNDLDVLVSPYRSILVANATDEVKRRAVQQCDTANVTDSLYIASGLNEDLNGNYAAGIIEGLIYFFPQIEEWLGLTKQG